jgi:hypothetical protein
VPPHLAAAGKGLGVGPGDSKKPGPNRRKAIGRITRTRNPIHEGVFSLKTRTPACAGERRNRRLATWTGGRHPKPPPRIRRRRWGESRSRLSCSGLSTFDLLPRRPSPLHPGNVLRLHACRGLRWAEKEPDRTRGVRRKPSEPAGPSESVKAGAGLYPVTGLYLAPFRCHVGGGFHRLGATRPEPAP